MVTTLPYCNIELELKEGMKLKVNGYRVKHYLGKSMDLNFICKVELEVALVIKTT